MYLCRNSCAFTRRSVFLSRDGRLIWLLCLLSQDHSSGILGIIRRGLLNVQLVCICCCLDSTSGLSGGHLWVSYASLNWTLDVFFRNPQDQFFFSKPQFFLEIHLIIQKKFRRLSCVSRLCAIKSWIYSVRNSFSRYRLRWIIICLKNFIKMEVLFSVSDLSYRMMVVGGVLQKMPVTTEVSLYYVIYNIRDIRSRYM